MMICTTIHLLLPLNLIATISNESLKFLFIASNVYFCDCYTYAALAIRNNLTVTCLLTWNIINFGEQAEGNYCFLLIITHYYDSLKKTLLHLMFIFVVNLLSGCES